MSLKQDGVYCIYRHLKPNGEVFYIGIGSTLKRPYETKGRNKYWKNKVKKYPDYEVQILKTGLTKEEACELETILISWYKRADCCGGTLVNLTDGGESTYGRIMEQWQRDEMSERLKGTMLGEDNPNFGNTWSEDKKKYMSDLKKEGYANGTLKINKEGVYKGIEERNRRWKENPQLKKNMSIKVAEKIAKNNLLKIDRDTGEVLEVFSNFVELKDKYPNVGKSVIYSVCNGNKKSYQGFLWRYQNKESLEIIEPKVPEDKNKKKVICKNSFIVYESCTFLAKLLDVKRGTLNAKLNGKNPNNTPYQYLEDFLRDNPDFDTTLFTYYGS